MDNRKVKDTRGGLQGGLGGILRGLGDLVEKLADLDQQGELSKTGTIRGPGLPGQVRGIYGFTVKVGLGDQGPRMEVAPFGNIRRDESSGRTEVQEVR